jgi:uncharacterized membrane protein YciS (DUF1049 family)
VGVYLWINGQDLKNKLNKIFLVIAGAGSDNFECSSFSEALNSDFLRYLELLATLFIVGYIIFTFGFSRFVR